MEKFDSRSILGPEAADSQVGARDIVQVLLLGAVIHVSPASFKPSRLR